jgi:S1-C subfamily serine protease
MKAALVLIALLAASSGQATGLDAPTQKRVRAATFEVVVPKPSEETVTYERSPPYELLPFTERNDKFWPSGTAFAIGENTFVTAAHVLTSSLGGQAGAPMLRDAQGKTYPIERVLKYSGHQDFVMFTAGVKVASPLSTKTEVELDATVFAVGNAYGEGVVMRDGLLTSLTPEDQDGRWKWLRYSAATSPGNSGGPLLDAGGRVVGVVIGKSENENLNYALPIAHVLEAPETARIDQRYPLRVPILRDSIVARYDITIPLPLSITEFAARFAGEIQRGFLSERSRLLTEKAAQLPPRGKTETLFGEADWAVCPMLVMQAEDRSWKPDDGSRDSEELPEGAKVCSRMAAGIVLFSLDRGKSTDPAFYADRRKPMDLLLAGFKLPRPFGQENVLVTSLGGPVRGEEHRDHYGRHWNLAVFAVPYADSHLVVLLLPTPDGYAGMLGFATRGALPAVAEQLRFMSDFFYVSYEGTLPQWQSFLKRTDKPEALASVTLTRDVQGVHFRSSRVDFDVPPNLLSLDDSSSLQLRMSYAPSGTAMIWGVNTIFVSNEKKDERFFSLERIAKPSEGGGAKLVDRWEDLIESRGDFSPGRGHDAEFKKFWRRAAISATSRPGTDLDRGATLFYAVTTTVNGAKLPREVDDMHDQLLENVRVKER